MYKMRQRMGQILIGLAMLGAGLWYFLPYILVLGQKSDIEPEIIQKISILYSQVCLLSKSNSFTQKYPVNWSKGWNEFQKKQEEKALKRKEENKGKELPMLTYTKEQQEKIDTSKLAGYVFQYRKLKMFFLLFYAPFIFLALFYPIFLGGIKRVETANKMQASSENFLKLGYVGLLLAFAGFFIFFVVCPEIFMKNTINPSIPIGVLSFLLAISVYQIMAQMPITQATTPGK